MNDWKSMTEAEKNEWIAENVMGWSKGKRVTKTLHGGEQVFEYYGLSIDEAIDRQSWSPMSSLDDARKVVERMKERQPAVWRRFLEKLAEAMGWDIDCDDPFAWEDVYIVIEGVLLSTPADICEAAHAVMEEKP